MLLSSGHFSFTVGDCNGCFNSWDTLATNSATANKHFTLSTLSYLESEVTFMQAIKEQESHAERLTPAPLGITVTKGMMLNKDYATAIDDFHTLVSEAATRCPPWQSGNPLGNV